MSDKFYGCIPVGRLIMGNIHEKQVKDKDGKVIPEEDRKFFFGVAVPKTQPGLGNMMGGGVAEYTGILGDIQLHAFQSYSNKAHVQEKIKAGLNGQFAFKIDDGDAPGYKNKHAAGCIVFKFSTTLPFTMANAQNQQIDPKMAKIGDWVDVSISVSINGRDDHTAGIYLNPQTVRLQGYGEAIVMGPSIDDQFANSQVSLPAGVSSTPVTTGSSTMPGMDQSNTGGTTMPGMDQSNTGGGMDQSAPTMPGMDQGQQPHNTILDPASKPMM